MTMGKSYANVLQDMGVFSVKRVSSSVSFLRTPLERSHDKFLD